MKKDPCEMCIVKACCKIPLHVIYWRCGCDAYEMHRIQKHLDSLGNTRKLTLKDYGVTFYNNRMKQLKERLS